MEKFYSNTQHCMIQQISINKAKSLFDRGVTIFIQSSNMPFDGMWFSALDINFEHGVEFEALINSFRVYNCNDERGNYIHFYVKANDNIN